MPKFVLLLFTALLVAACGSTGGSDGPNTTTGDNIRVTWRDYRSGLVLELVSNSHTDPAELYSTARGTASTKVQGDLFMVALVDEFFRGEGYFEYSNRGPAPAQSNVGTWHAIEVDWNGDLSHLTVGPNSAKAIVTTYNDCRRGFIELYNATDGLQAVDNPEGVQYFEKQKPKPSKKSR